mmetsp:Transcript_40063/g.127511  ORF Transcript_40063/g.127511 Transcript_40063/m.127511 type:complete len:192 (-) Transcript_40063:77-652(-)
MERGQLKTAVAAEHKRSHRSVSFGDVTEVTVPTAEVETGLGPAQRECTVDCQKPAAGIEASTPSTSPESPLVGSELENEEWSLLPPSQEASCSDEEDVDALDVTVRFLSRAEERRAQRCVAPRYPTRPPNEGLPLPVNSPLWRRRRHPGSPTLGCTLQVEELSVEAVRDNNAGSSCSREEGSPHQAAVYGT